MKITKWMLLFTLAVFVVGFMACGGGGKYSDLKPVVKKYNQNTEKFINAMEKADSAEKVAAAMNDYVKKMGELKSKMEEMEEKYPELKTMSGPPPELGEEGKKMGELTNKMATAMMKAFQYADDPAVKKAQEEFEKIMK